MISYEEKVKIMKNAFWDWYYDYYIEDVQTKDDDIEFQERNFDKILEKFAEVVGLI